MSPLTLFGVVAVTAMLVCYALEERSRIFVLLFASACAASSIYGFLQGAWPFGAVEAVWTGVAVNRWRMRATPAAAAVSTPIACDMSAFSRDERLRYDDLRARVLAAVDTVSSTDCAFQFRLSAAVASADVAEWLAMEHRCCPFADLAMTLRGDGTRWIELGGSAPIKDFLRHEFSVVFAR